MKKPKYDINSDFKKIKWFKTPMSYFAIFFARAFRWLVPKGKKHAQVKETKMKIGSKDGKKVKVIFYESKDSVGVKQPCLLYFHGGAFVYPAIWHHYRCARLYARNGVKVALVDYRLAPHYKYPVGSDDCFAVYEYLVKNADKLNVYGDRIALGGDSAGGFYVLSTLKRAEEEKLPPPKALMMIYPVVDANEDNYSIKTYVDTPIWNSRANKKMWKYHSDGKCPISPFDWGCYNDLNEVYIETAEYDCLRDRATELAGKLEGEGVNVTLNQTEGTVHGYDVVFDSEITKESVKMRLSFLHRL